MGAQTYLKGVAKAVLAPVIKSIGAVFPTYGAGIHMSLGRSFIYDFKNMSAYTNKIYYAAQNLLVRKYLETPIIVNKKKATTGAAAKFKYEQFYSPSIDAVKRFAIKQLALQEIPDHDLALLLENPNGYQSGLEMWEDFWHNYDFGNGFIWFESPGDEFSRINMPVALHSMSPQRVTIIPSTEERDGVGGYRYTTRSGKTFVIDKKYVFHFKKWNPTPNDLWGLDPSAVLAPMIGLDDASVEAQGASFVNGGRGTLFSSDKHIDSNQNTVEKMSAAQMEVLRDDIEDSYSGTSNNRKQHFTNGFVNVQNYGDTLAEMELVQSSSSYWEYIFGAKGIPETLCPTKKPSSENSVKAGYIALVTNLIVPDLKMFNQGFTKACRRFWKDVIVCNDITEFAELAPNQETMQKVFGSPEITVDERRALYNYDAIGGKIGSAILVDSGKMLIDDVIDGQEEDGTDPNDLDENASL